MLKGEFLILFLCLIAIAFSSFTSFMLMPKACKGQTLCFEGKVEKVIDGDSLIVDGHKIRLALVNTLERGELPRKAKDFVEKLCKDKIALIDQDDGQPYDVYGRIVALVHCQGKNLNLELLNHGYGRILKKYCKLSEFRELCKGV